MALFVCSNIFEDGDIYSEEGRSIRSALKAFVPSREAERKFIHLGMKGDFEAIMKQILGIRDVKKFTGILSRVMAAFGNPDDLQAILSFMENPEISKNLGQLTSVVTKIEPEHLEGTAKALGKIDPVKLAKLDDLLSQVNVSLATVIADPTALFTLIGSPIVIEASTLIPQFSPEDLNHILTVKKRIEDNVPNAKEVLGLLLSLPFHILPKVFDLKLQPEEMKLLQGVAGKFLGNGEVKPLMEFALKKWNILEPQGRSALAGNCSMELLSVKCVDNTIDLCPNGHVTYGLATACILLLPGVIYGVSEFLHLKSFSLGNVFWEVFFG